MTATASQAPALPAGLNLTRRAPWPTDTAHLVSSWLQSFLRTHEDMNDYRPAVMAHLERGRVEIACLVEEPDVIVGWTCWSDANTLQYAHIKPRFRGRGLFRWLLADRWDDAVVYTHEMRDFPRMDPPPLWQYRPFLKWRTS